MLEHGISGVLRASKLVNSWRFRGSGRLKEGMEALFSFLTLCSTNLFCLVVPFIVNHFLGVVRESQD